MAAHDPNPKAAEVSPPATFTTLTGTSSKEKADDIELGPVHSDSQLNVPDVVHSRSRSTAASSLDNDDKVPSPPAAPSTTATAVTGTEKKKRFGFGKKKAVDKDDKDGKKGKDDTNVPKPVGFFRLFRFATKFELTINFIGLVLAAAAGATQPLMTLIFGRLTTAFNVFAVVLISIEKEGLTPTNIARLADAKKTLKKDAGDNALYLMAIGLGLFVCTYAYMLIWNWTSEKQSKRMREVYLRSVLRQEVSEACAIDAHTAPTQLC